MLTLPSTQPRTSESPFAAAVLSKEAAVARWVGRRLGAVTHERQVASVASNLFDLTRPLHGMGVADRRLLRLGALVHDVGRAVDKARHPAVGADMVLSAGDALPLSATERRLLAYLTAHHKGEVPPAGDDAFLSPTDDPARMLRLLAFLRAADALDSRSLETPRLVFALGGDLCQLPVELRVHCYLQSDTPKACKVYRRRKKFRLLEDVLNCRVEIEIAHAHALRLVA